jgi:hypothetical protein
VQVWEWEWVHATFFTRTADAPMLWYDRTGGVSWVHAPPQHCPIFLFTRPWFGNAAARHFACALLGYTIETRFPTTFKVATCQEGAVAETGGEGVCKVHLHLHLHLHLYPSSPQWKRRLTAKSKRL